jgi:hypothetical protein
LPTKSVRFRDYSSSLNPPILHRKELMLPESHPDQHRLREVTKLAESIGLFDDPVRIGFRNQWNRARRVQGLRSRGSGAPAHGNVTDARTLTAAVGEPPQTMAVLRHLTALSRSFPVGPVQACCATTCSNRDARSLTTAAARVTTSRASAPRNRRGRLGPLISARWRSQPAEVVNLGFVINVIEDFGERIEALQGAYELTQGVLVSLGHALVDGSPKGRRMGMAT